MAKTLYNNLENMRAMKERLGNIPFVGSDVKDIADWNLIRCMSMRGLICPTGRYIAHPTRKDRNMKEWRINQLNLTMYLKQNDARGKK